jgi:hypothetical protein
MRGAVSPRHVVHNDSLAFSSVMKNVTGCVATDCPELRIFASDVILAFRYQRVFHFCDWSGKERGPAAIG